MTRDVSPADDDRRPDSPVRRIDTAGNLLLGLLALQNHFIDRDTLVGAFDSWIADRSRGLGQVLLERGALSPMRRQLLDALVEEHIRIHGDDPEKSLAALSSIGAVRDDLSRVADPEVQDSLAHVPAMSSDEHDPTAPQPLPVWVTRRPPAPGFASSVRMPKEDWARFSSRTTRS